MIIATDLDRTLLPNGLQEYDGSMDLFKSVIEKNRLGLVFVTGRNIEQVNEAREEFNLPDADYIIGEVGTKIYAKLGGGYEPDTKWIALIKSKTHGWNTEAFKEELALIKGLRMQEEWNQNELKLSYYVDKELEEKVVKEVTKLIKAECDDATIVYSFDETHEVGLLDILPKSATKVGALEYLRHKLNLKMDDIVYCGDSGNDLLPLTKGYYAIVVRNAIDDVRTAVKQRAMQKGILDRVCFAEGFRNLNGYYVSGIIEGLVRLNIISSLEITG